MNRSLVISFIVAVGLVAGLFAWQKTTSSNRITLQISGYGYEIGDIVYVDPKKIPVIGDVVFYDAYLNKSYCGAMGPGVGLAKIAGLPGDRVRFKGDSFSVNGQDVDLQNDNSRLPLIILGDKQYREIPEDEIIIPTGVFIPDKWIGMECTGETNESGVTVFYNRFDVRLDAIRGVIVRKLGHDRKFEEDVKSRIY